MRILVTLFTVFMVLFGSGCAQLPREPNNSIAPIVTQLPLIETPKPDVVVGLAATSEKIEKVETIDADDSARDVELTDESMFIERLMQGEGDVMPDVDIKKISFGGGSVLDFMNTLLLHVQHTSYVITSETAQSGLSRRYVSASNVSGKLSNILDVFSRKIGFFWFYKNGVIELSPDAQFIAKIPPINDIFESLPQMLKTLGGNAVFLDKTARTITYRATKPVHERIESYLAFTRRSKAMIVYDTNIWEVVLKDGRDTGIQWNKLASVGTIGGAPYSFGLIGGSAANLANSVSAGVVYTGKHFSLDVLANFLQTQGTLNTISQPKISLLSGGAASFRNGKTTYYVSGIGAPTVVNGSVIQGAATTTPLQTGLRMSVSGDISDGTVYTNINLILTDLIGFSTYPAGSNQVLSLPELAEREVHTDVRARSGDTILIAGINSERLSHDLAGLPGGGQTLPLATKNSKATERTELVIVMKPRVIRFTRRVDSR